MLCPHGMQNKVKQKEVTAHFTVGRPLLSLVRKTDLTDKVNHFMTVTSMTNVNKYTTATRGNIDTLL